jgi:hypothetical protein
MDKNAPSFNTTGSFNTTVGLQLLDPNNGDHNTGIGDQALLFNATGTPDTASGALAPEEQRYG